MVVAAAVQAARCECGSTPPTAASTAPAMVAPSCNVRSVRALRACSALLADTDLESARASLEGIIAKGDPVEAGIVSLSLGWLLVRAKDLNAATQEFKRLAGDGRHSYFSWLAAVSIEVIESEQDDFESYLKAFLQEVARKSMNDQSAHGISMSIVLPPQVRADAEGADHGS